MNVTYKIVDMLGDSLDLKNVRFGYELPVEVQSVALLNDDLLQVTLRYRHDQAGMA